MKFTTPVETDLLDLRISFKDRIFVLGSCFADEIGSRMIDAGYHLCLNPFGTLYNPASLVNALCRLENPVPFCAGDCVMMGAGAGLWCSFEHHTTFARRSVEDFLAVSNDSLSRASEFWKEADVVILSLGTARVWRHLESGAVVSNCLKRPACEFSNEMLSLEEISACLERFAACGKRLIVTVSPIRHMSRGAADNTLSKSLLHVAAHRLSEAYYFPAYEILCDELRDYRFYASDMVHPSPVAADYIWEKFQAAAFLDSEAALRRSNEKAARSKAHRPLLFEYEKADLSCRSVSSGPVSGKNG